MKTITSLFDFFNKVETDKRYEKVAIIAYEESLANHYSSGRKDKCEYTQAKGWIRNWVNDNSSKDNYFDCHRMVNYLNDCMRKIPNWQDDTPKPPISKHNMT